MDVATYQKLGLHRSMADGDAARLINGRSNSEIQAALETSGDQKYHPCPEANPAPESPRDRVKSHRA